MVPARIGGPAKLWPLPPPMHHAQRPTKAIGTTEQQAAACSELTLLSDPARLYIVAVEIDTNQIEEKLITKPRMPPITAHTCITKSI